MGKIWPYSPQYNTIIGEGFHRPHPKFGAPTLVWHVGVWQNLMSDQVDLKKLEEEASSENAEQYRRSIEREFLYHDVQSRKLYREISQLILCLQEHGCQSDIEPEELKFVAPEYIPGENLHERFFTADSHTNLYKFRVCDPQSIEFTLWWQDEASDCTLNQRQEAPKPSDIRVHVQLQTYSDHATLTFYIDVSKPWSSEAIYDRQDIVGTRRAKIFEYIDAIRASAKKQNDTGFVNYDRMPEKGVEDEEAKSLLDAANYLYEGVWRDLLSSFGLSEDRMFRGEENDEKKMEEDKKWRLDQEKMEGRRFADFRGLVMSVDEIQRDEKLGWIRSGVEDERQKKVDKYETFNDKTGEPNRVLKAHWPFFRRVIPWADYRDIVGCGLINFRALFMTSQKSSAAFNEKEETSGRDYDVPAGNLSRFEKTSMADSRPIRYLILTKGKPHREQIGRFVERVNAIGTMRLFALKSWPAIRNASYHIRLLGRELDSILTYWNTNRQIIDKRWKEKDLEIRQKQSRKKQKKKSENSSDNIYNEDYEFEDMPSMAAMRNNDKRVAKLNALISHTERQVISLSASLDRIGLGGSGRLLYAIKRSENFIREFHDMASTLQMKDIDTWINYEQFVQRGLKPTFNYISSTGVRLVSLRKRLEVITQTIQTSALIIEAEATRMNTQTLRKIAWNFSVIRNTGIAGVSAGIFGMCVWFAGGVGKVLEFINHLLGIVTNILPIL